MAMARKIPEMVALPLMYSVKEYKKAMAYMLFFPSTDLSNMSNQQHLIFQISCPICHHYHPLYAYSLPLKHDNNIRKN